MLLKHFGFYIIKKLLTFNTNKSNSLIKWNNKSLTFCENYLKLIFKWVLWCDVIFSINLPSICSLWVHGCGMKEKINSIGFQKKKILFSFGVKNYYHFFLFYFAKFIEAKNTKSIWLTFILDKGQVAFARFYCDFE